MMTILPANGRQRLDATVHNYAQGDISLVPGVGQSTQKGSGLDGQLLTPSLPSGDSDTLSWLNGIYGERERESGNEEWCCVKLKLQLLPVESLSQKLIPRY